MEEMNQLMDTYRNFVTKYSYYIVALCVASIGFSITQTIGYKLSVYLIPLGISVFLFAISVMFGLGFINTMTKGMTTEITLKRIQLGWDEVAGSNPLEQEKRYNSVAKNIAEQAGDATFYRDAQLWCFYLGVLAFITWRIIEMYNIT